MWNRHRWEPDLLKRAERAAQNDARRRLAEAVRIAPSFGDEMRKEALKWAIQSESRFRIDAVIELAQKHERISVNTVSGWDANPWLLGVANGVVDLRTGGYRPGAQDDLITKQAGVQFDARATCARWEQFVSEVLSDD